MKSMQRAGQLSCVLVMVGTMAGGAVGCERVQEYVDAQPPPPAVSDVAAYYAEHRGVDSVRLNGNVAVLHVEQPFDQLERGGSLWARVGPFVYLMTPATRAAFNDHEGLAAVRVITHLSGGEEVARAMLRRDALSGVQWRRTLNILGHALQAGQENPRKLEELTEWSERHTEYRYNPDYVNH